MDVFKLRDDVVAGYSDYVRSFLTIADEQIKNFVEQRFADGHLWPDALVQLNPAFRPGATIAALVDEGVLHPECARVFRRGKDVSPDGQPLRLHQHQEDAVRIAASGASYVLTTGTGSGKSLAYFIPIVNDVLRHPTPGRVSAIVVYPWTASTPTSTASPATTSPTSQSSSRSSSARSRRPTASPARPASAWRPTTISPGQRGIGLRNELAHPQDVMIPGDLRAKGEREVRWCAEPLGLTLDIVPPPEV